MYTRLKIAMAVVLGLVVLLPACWLKAWTGPDYPSIKKWPSGTPNQGPARYFRDRWAWSWLNAWYENIEDGVSGMQAWVWKGSELVPYFTLYPLWAPAWAIAYGWSAWRNSANNLKRPLRNDSWSKANGS